MLNVLAAFIPKKTFEVLFHFNRDSGNKRFFNDLFLFKLGHSAAQRERNIDQTLGKGPSNERSLRRWFMYPDRAKNGHFMCGDPIFVRMCVLHLFIFNKYL